MQFIKTTLIIISLTAIYTNTFAQGVAINTDGSDADPCALLDVKSNEKGILVPRVNIEDLSTAAPVSSPVNGLLVYNTNTATNEGYFYWNGSAWIQLKTDGDERPPKWSGTSSTSSNIGRTGNIGIGTTSPTAQLHTTSTVRFSNYTDGFLKVDNSGNLGIGTGSELFNAGDGLSWSSNTLNSVWKENGTNIYYNNGYVGIGTSTPYAALDVTSSAGLKVSHSLAQFIQLIAEETNQKIVTCSDFRFTSGGNIQYATSGDEGNPKMVITTGGNVGVSRTDPAQKLDVLGRMRASDPTSSTSKWIDIYSDTDQFIETTNELYLGTKNTSNIYLQPGRIGSSDAHVHIRNNAGTNWASFDGVDQRLGIGTDDPDYRLHVYHNDFSDNYLNYTYMRQTSSGENVNALYAYRTRDAQYDGSGYGHEKTNTAIKGQVVEGDKYTFAVHGSNYNDETRCGGTLGSNSNGTYWGSLGYKNSSSNTYGAYYTSSTEGTGFNNYGGSYAGIGAGGYGDLLGLWSRGRVMGQIVSGELFSSYNMGNTYTTGTQVEIICKENERLPAYSVTSREMKVYDNGFAKLIGNEVFVPFEKSFSDMIKNERPVVTVTPIGSATIVFIKSISNEGFTIASEANCNLEFSWIAVGTRIDNETIATFPDDLKDINFDKNMKEFMFNENNKERNAKAIWWNGKNLQFGVLPAKFINIETKPKETSFNPQNR